MVDDHESGSAGDDTAGTEADALIPIATDAPLMIGNPVVAADGDVLGTVDEDAGDRFKVAAPMAEDYWLPRHLIAGMAPGGDLVVSVDKESLDSAKLAAPDEA